MTSEQSESGDKIEHEKVKLLFDYTKFHIGLYTTLVTIIIGVLNLKIGHSNPSGTGSTPLAISVVPELLWTSASFILLAGFAGGVVASTLPHCSSLKHFWSCKIGPYDLKILSGKSWTYVEHTAFWLGIAAAICAFGLAQHRDSM